MDQCSRDLTRLSLLIHRLLDADMLCDTEGAPLLTQTEAARHCLEEGDAEEARRHIAQVALFTEALIREEALEWAEGRTILETAHRLLAEDAG
ncbi:MAG: hypothetical protein JWL77_8 [Chthonomonadaceae bacterium]|nr:hypothetical protein [Chthonomonadaceae bacterium]